MAGQFTAVVADIGGTNTRVALCDGATVRANSILRYRNSEHAGIVSILEAYLADRGVRPGAACVAMAGPVRDGVGTLTNLDWRVDATEIADATGAGKSVVLNDLQAQGHALAHLGPEAFDTIKPGADAVGDAPRLVVGVGTGFNVAFVVSARGETVVPPSESGHATLPLQTDDDMRLYKFLSQRHAVPGVEDALSGRGLERLYLWHATEDDAPDDEMAAADIMAACASGENPRAKAAVATFVTLLGRVAGDLALVHLPFGGLYLCGGVSRAMGPHLGPFGFEKAFRHKGRFSGFMDQFPVRMVTDDYAALTGSAAHLAEVMAAG